MDKIVKTQATDAELPPNSPIAPNDVMTIKQKYNAPIVFLREKELFGDRRPERTEWVQHVEMYRAIGTKINVAHITGLQRVRGLWRIYLDNIQDKVTLMAEGVPLRGKTIPVLNTNPDRFDGEETVRVRIKNIPLSVEDGLIKRTITLKNIEVISMYREKLRVDGKLTNCETGDRIIVVKASSLKEPLPFTMSFGHFTGRVLHTGQQTSVKTAQKCSKCLQDGHTFSSCTNDWVCTLCNKSGHKRTECVPADTDSEEADGSDAESTSSESSDDDAAPMQQTKKRTKSKEGHGNNTQPKHKGKKKKGRKSVKQQSIDKYVTPQRNKSSCAQERSPPTPTDELHDKQVQHCNGKKHKK